MILHVFDKDFTYMGRVENYISMSWTEQYQDEGKFNLVAYDTDQYAKLLQKGYYFYRTDRPTAMMAVKVERDTDENTITASGYTTLHLLSRRIIDLAHIFTNVEAGVYNAISWELRSLPYVECAPAKGLTEACDFEIEGEGLLDAVLTVIKESSYGIRAVFDYKNKKHIIEVYEGVDRSYDSANGGTVFSQEFGNLRSLVVTEDDDLYKNVAYVTGASDTSSETVYYQYVAPYAGEQENWREIVVRGENQKESQTTAQWQARQRAIAAKELQKHRSGLTFEVDLSLGIFGQKYDLGDSVTCKTRRYGLQFDTRISEYKYTYKKGTEAVKLTMGDKPLDWLEGAIVKHG